MAPSDGGNRKRLPRRRWVEPGATPRAHLRRKAEELMRDAGLPQHLAMRVAKGELKLQDALSQLGDKDRVEKLITRHGLERSLATQVVLGRVSLDQILARRRMKEHIAQHHSRSLLDDALTSGRELVFGLHSRRLVRARVVGLNTYEVKLEASSEDAPAGELGLMHKLQLKFALLTDDLTLARGILEHDASNEAQEPIERPQDRYRCANKRLFSWVDAKTPVEVTTLESDVVCGPIAWIGRWELGLLGADDMEIVIFRHAISNISGGKWGSIKDD